MPAVSKAQRKLFGLALAVKRGEVDASTVDQKIRDLSKKKEADLKDYAETPEETLPNKLEDSVDENAELQEAIAYAEAMRYALEENNAMATPGSVNGMGDVSLPGNPGTQAEFSTQETGSGDLAASSELTDDEKENEKQAKNIYNFLKFNAFVGESVTEGINEAKDNLYLQLHKKYAEQIQGLKAKKIKKLTDLVSVQRWAMEDREDYFDLTKSEIKEISSVFNDERKLFKKYMDGDHSVLLPESVNESSGRDPKSIQKEYKELKKASIDYLRREWSRHFRIGDPKGTDRAGLISDLLRAYHGDKYVDAAFEALETTDTHEQLAEIKKHEQAIYDSGESGAISSWESFAKRVIGKDGMWKDAPFQSYTDAVRELKSIMTKYSIKA